MVRGEQRVVCTVSVLICVCGMSLRFTETVK